MLCIKRFITSEERELKDSRGTGMFKSCFGISSRYLRVLWFILVLTILARNIDCKSILQKTLNQFGLVASKYERKLRCKSKFQCISLRRRVCLIVGRYVSPTCVSVWFLQSKPCLFPLKSSLKFVLHRGKPKFISLPVKFPADRSKFQFCATEKYNNFLANCAAVFVLLFF